MQRSLSSLSLDEELDNANTNWVGGKGTWCMYLLGIVTFRLTLHVCGVDRQTAWTVLNLSHAAFSFYYVHWLKGMPMFRSATRSPRAAAQPLSAPVSPARRTALTARARQRDAGLQREV